MTHASHTHFAPLSAATNPPGSPSGTTTPAEEIHFATAWDEPTRKNIRSAAVGATFKPTARWHAIPFERALVSAALSDHAAPPLPNDTLIG